MQTYQDAAEYLGSKQDRPSPNHGEKATRVHRVSETAIAVRYHRTDVVTYHADGSIVLDNGGWQTSTTKNRIGEYSPVRVFCKSGLWYACLPGQWDTAKPYANGLTYHADGTMTGYGADDVASIKRKLDRRVRTTQTTTAGAIRIRFEYDTEARFEECNGEPRPLTADEYRENAYQRDGVDLPYDEYLRYYGNPERHIYLMSVAQRQCVCCKSWSVVGSLGYIDFMDDSPEYLAVKLDHWYTEAEARALPGDLRDCLPDIDPADVATLPDGRDPRDA